MMSVWPIASTPTTITCCSTSERLGPWRKRSLFSEKNAIVSNSARNGPTAGAARNRRIHSSGDRTLGGWAEVCVALNVDLLPEEPILGGFGGMALVSRLRCSFRGEDAGSADR